MIPKIIHYFWQSPGPMPRKLQDCIASWKKYCPDFEMRCWTGNSLGEDTPLWVTQALENKKFAFAADYMRYYALYHFGGIYMDTDVELLRPFGKMLDAPYLMGHESVGSAIESGFLAVEPGNPFVKAMLDYYDGRQFVKPDGTLDMRGLPDTIAEIFKTHGFSVRDVETPAEITDANPKELCVLPSDYFSPISLQTYALTLTPRTVAIHHFLASWKPRRFRYKKLLQRALGPKITMAIIRCKDILLNRTPLK